MENATFCFWISKLTAKGAKGAAGGAQIHINKKKVSKIIFIKAFWKTFSIISRRIALKNRFIKDL